MVSSVKTFGEADDSRAPVFPTRHLVGLTLGPLVRCRWTNSSRLTELRTASLLNTDELPGTCAGRAEDVGWEGRGHLFSSKPRLRQLEVEGRLEKLPAVSKRPGFGTRRTWDRILASPLPAGRCRAGLSVPPRLTPFCPTGIRTASETFVMRIGRLPQARGRAGPGRCAPNHTSQYQSRQITVIIFLPSSEKLRLRGAP